MNDEKPNNELSWPLNSEVLEKEIVNEKMPNKYMYTIEDRDYLRVKICEILHELAKKRDQINFDSETAREQIASVIANKL